MRSFTKLTYRFSQHPTNDPVSSPETLGVNWSQTRWNVNATAEAGEIPAIAGQAASKSVWWRYQPVHNGTLSLTTSGSGFDTVLAVFRQEALPFSFGSLTRLASNDDANPSTSTSAISGLELKANKTYWICVDGYQGATGEITLTDAWVPSSRPDNDDFADATALNAASDLVGDNATATLEPDEPQHLTGGNASKSLWYRFVPPTNGAVTVDLRGTAFDSVLSLYRGTTLSGLVKIAENHGTQTPPIVWSRLSRVSVQGGVHYYLAVSGADGSSGSVTGTFRFSTQPSAVSLTPDHGPAAGGNWIEVHGSDLDGSNTRVYFGDTQAQVEVPNEETQSTLVRAKVPAGLPVGPITVTVATNGGNAGTTLSYIVGVPELTALSARYVRVGGGQRVQVVGADFLGVPSVSVGGMPATGVAVSSPTSLSFVTPKHSAGDAEVRISTSVGQSSASTAGWLTYLDPRRCPSSLGRRGHARVDTTWSSPARASASSPRFWWGRRRRSSCSVPAESTSSFRRSRRKPPCTSAL